MQFLDLAFWDAAFRGLMALICRFIYPIISFLYSLFENITQIRILDSSKIEPIYQRVTMILTIIMVFYITFQFVKYVVQPDSLTDKEKGAGNIAYRMIIVIVLIAFVPKIFNAAYEIQHIIVKENVISKVILGPQATSETELGANFSATIFSMFYSVSDENRDQDCYDGLTCENLVDFNIMELKTKNSLNSITMGLNATENKKSETPLINFDGLYAVIVGGFVLYILILYSIDVGARWAQLIYLQIISPIAIIGYISPKKDGVFQKWLKQCITTYLDLFLRIAIINIALLICDVLLKSFSGDENLLENLGELSWYMEILIYIVLIMGVLMFAHKAPKMLSELFPKSGAASGNFGLKATERVAPEVARVAGAALGSTRFLGGAVGRGVNTYRRNREERERTGETRKMQRERHREDRRQLSQANEEYRRARANRNAAIRNQGRRLNADQAEEKAYEEARDKLNRAKSTVAEDKSNKYRSVVGNTVAGAVGGFYHGAREGVKATKLEDIGKQVKAGAKSDREAIASREKWLDSVGGSTIDKTISKFQQNVGIQTSAQRTAEEIKVLDAEIKHNEELSKAEEALKQSADKAKDTGDKKMEEGKLKNQVPAGTYGNITSAPGDTVDKIYGQAKTRRIETEEALKAAIQEGRKKTKKQVPQADGSYIEMITEEPQADYDARINALKAQQEEARKGEIETKKKLNDETRNQILEKLSRGITPDTNPGEFDGYDAGMIQQIQAQLISLEIAKRNPETVEAVEKYFDKLIEIERNGTNDPTVIAEYEQYRREFESGNISSFSSWDTIEKAMLNIANNRNNITTFKKNTKQTLENSSMYSAQKADDAANGGKK